LCGIFLYLGKDSISGYIVSKARRIAENTANHLIMTDVQYILSKPDDNGMVKAFVSGVIRNKDQNMARLEGVRVSIYDGTKELKTWDTVLSRDYIIPGESLNFSTTNVLKNPPKDLRVEVSIF
jgi:hypothetical protein